MVIISNDDNDSHNHNHTERDLCPLYLLYSIHEIIEKAHSDSLRLSNCNIDNPGDNS